MKFPDYVWTEGEFLVTKFEFAERFSMSLEGDCHEVKVTPNLEFFSHFWYEFGGSLS
jgi:hypothetical protein